MKLFQILSAGPLPQFRKLAFRVHWIVVHALRLMDSVRVFSGTTLTGIINYVSILRILFFKLSSSDKCVDQWSDEATVYVRAQIEQFGPYGLKQSTPIVVEVDKDGKIINSLQVKSQNSEVRYFDFIWKFHTGKLDLLGTIFVHRCLELHSSQGVINTLTLGPMLVIKFGNLQSKNCHE